LIACAKRRGPARDSRARCCANVNMRRFRGLASDAGRSDWPEQGTMTLDLT
jgi:hypothetical protein